MYALGNAVKERWDVNVGWFEDKDEANHNAIRVVAEQEPRWLEVGVRAIEWGSRPGDEGHYAYIVFEGDPESMPSEFQPIEEGRPWWHYALPIGAGVFVLAGVTSIILYKKGIL